MIRLRRLALVAVLAAPAASAGEHGKPVVLAESAGIRVADGYAISSGPNAPTGAAFMRITNLVAAPDRLVAVESPAARRSELHAHVLEGGVARMVKLDDGIAIAAGQTVTLQHRGLHVMLMGLTGPLTDGAEIPITLVFEIAGPVVVEIPVDRDHESSGH